MPARRIAISSVAVTVALSSLVAAAPAFAARERPTGIVFVPNPVVALRDPTLVDDRDADSPAFAAAYRVVRLRNLDHSGFLRGTWASVCATQCVYKKKERFLFDRSHPGFEQVTAYWAITKAQRYVRSLGFDDVNAEQQDVIIRSGVDESSYDPNQDRIVFGLGGVDDAEDMELIWHEYAHAMQLDRLPAYGATADERAIGEGYADYWAFTMSEPLSDGYDPACIADWDAVSYSTSSPPCLRRVDLDLRVDDRTGSPHEDGRIWSRALYDIHLALGRETADTIVIDSHMSFTDGMSWADAAHHVVASAEALFGAPAADQVRVAFEARGIL